VSPWLLPAYEFGATTGFLFLAMPLVDGDTLAAVIVPPPPALAGFRRADRSTGWTGFRRRPISERWSPSRLGSPGRAAAAHAERVVHRDIKPANILIDRCRADGIYLCDFGLGRDLDAPPPAAWRHSTGTPLYMPRNALLGEAADEILCDVLRAGRDAAEARDARPSVRGSRGPPSPRVAAIPGTAPAPTADRGGPPAALRQSSRSSVGTLRRDPGDRYPR